MAEIAFKTTFDKIETSCKDSCKVTEVAVKAGDDVAAGDLLVELD